MTSEVETGLGEAHRPIRITVANIPYLTLLFFFGSLIITYVIYGVQGRYIGYVPDFAESAIGGPNERLFIVMMIFESFSLFILHTLHFTWGECNGFFRGPILAVMWFVAGGASLSLIGFAAFPFDQTPLANRVFTILFSVLTFCIFVMTFFLMLRRMTPSVLGVRSTLLFLMLVSGCCSSAALSAKEPRLRMTFSAISQILFIIFLSLYLLSWRPELKHLCVEFVNFS